MNSEEKVNILLVDDQPARLLSYDAILSVLGQNLVHALLGFETAALIHQHPRFERTPIIFVTAVHVTDLDRLKGYELGAVDYVYVPVVPEILRGKVEVLVELYRQRRELERLNTQLAKANDELARTNAAPAARDAYARAIGLERDDAVRRFLLRRRALLHD